MSIVHLAKGYAYTIEDGERKSVDAIHASKANDCCKLDCCTKGLYIQDIATGNVHVGWFENGVWTTGTVAQFDAARALYQ